MALPISTRPTFTLSQTLPSGGFHKPPILLHQRADRLKTTITENQPIWSHGPQPCLTQWNYEPCHVGPSKTDRSWWRILTQCGLLEKGMANRFSILALRTPWRISKRQTDITLKDKITRSVRAQYTTGHQWCNSSRKNEEAEPKWK